jgi:hypothetical protein
MKVRNIKVKTPSIPSRTAACQFIDTHGYDMEWVPEQQLFYVHDVQKNNLHVIHMDEVTNFALDVAEPHEFMAKLRGYVVPQLATIDEALLADAPQEPVKKPKAKPGPKPKAKAGDGPSDEWTAGE